MKPLRIALALASISTTAAFGADQRGCVDRDAKARAAAEAEVIAIHDAWATARKTFDTAFLEKFYDPGLVLQVADGTTISRDTDIALFRDRIIRAERIDDSDMKVNLFCTVAVATGIESLKGTYAGNPGEMSLRFLSVLERRGDTWRLVAHQSTIIKASAKP